MFEMAVQLAQMITLEMLYQGTEKSARYAARREGMEAALDIMRIKYEYVKNNHGDIIAAVVDGERVDVVRM